LSNAPPEARDQMEQTPPNAEAAAMRIQRRLDEVLDRQAAAGEVARTDALLSELRDAVRALPVAERGPVLGMLQRMYPEAPATAPVAAGPSMRERELEDEVARLTAALEARAAAPEPASSDLTAGLAKVLGLSARDLASLSADPEGAARLTAVVDTLVEFAVSLLRAYIPVTEDEDRSVAGMVKRLISDAVSGPAQETALREQIDRTRRQVGGQVVAFRRACEEGARAMLKSLSPAVIEAEASRGAGFLEKRFGVAAQCWELFVRRLEELRGSPELYQTHFDGPLRKELHRLAQARPGSEGKR
jgi:hypothetical protein